MRQQDASEEPRRFGRYVEIRLIGRGGMGQVLEAADARLGRRVAIKLMADSLVGDAEHRARFLREAKVAASVSHPNLATLFDVGEDDTRVWLVMELAPGRPARALVQEAPHPQLLIVAIQTARALGALHAAGVVHRDLKPDNIHVDENGGVKVLDFGLARPTEGGADFRSRLGQIAGTPAYMPPEVWREQAASPATDVYAFGVLLHELVTGKTAWPGWKPEEDEPSAWAGFPPELAALVADCLSVDPTRRPADGAALEARLAPLVPPVSGASPSRPPVSGASPSRPPVSGASPSRPPAQRTPMPRDTWLPDRGDEGDPANPRTATLRPLTAPPRTPTRWVAAALIGMAAVVTITMFVREAHLPADDTSPGTDVSELPNPATTEAGRRAWSGSMEAFRQGERSRMLDRTEELVAAEPELPEAWLRRALALYFVAKRDAAQEAFSEAFARADGLSERDRALLDSLAPSVQWVPVDRDEGIRRAQIASDAHPEDAELKFVWAYLLNSRAQVEDFRARSDEALRLDPNFAWISYTRSRRVENFGFQEEAVAQLALCADASPPAPICLTLRAQRADLAGDCASVALDQERELNRSPKDGDALRRRASRLLGTGSPGAAVLEAARIAREAGADVPVGDEPAVRARVAAWEGRFDDALVAAAEWEAAVAASSTEALRLPPRWLKVRVLEESGDPAGAAACAEDTLTLLDAWSPDRDRRMPTGRFAPALHAVRVAAGREAPEAFTSWLDAWEKQKIADMAPDISPIWFWSRALPTRSPADARVAMARLPEFGFVLGPARSHSTDPTLALAIGRVERLADLSDAEASLRMVAETCMVLGEPLAPVYARAELARLAEAQGDTNGACTAWKQVLGRWGAARPHSVLADEARARLEAGGCEEVP